MTATDPVLATPAGRIRGAWREGAYEFLGVPFGHAARFAAPGAATAWSGVRDATVPGPAAPQPDRPVARATHGPCPPQAEDCLTLNVWTPGLTGRRPVLVWLHGGGFTVGHAAASLYRGTTLAADGDLVVVSPTYRLGSLGWAAHPALAAEPGAPAANWGLLDQIAALRWVRETIGAFGGDPNRVTIAGQSAGALSAMDLLVAPGAGGLFRRAILQSPPMGDLAIGADRAADWTVALSREVAPAGAAEPDALRRASAAEIVAAHEHLLDRPAFRGTRGGALPTLDPATIPVSPADDPGASAEVDVLVGSTADEGTFFFGAPWRPAPPPDRIPGIIAHLTGRDPAEVLHQVRDRAIAAGRPTSALALLQQLATEVLVAGPVADWTRRRARALHPGAGRVFRYRVDHPGAGPDLRATHTCEVPLLFGTWRDGGPGQRLGGRAGEAGGDDGVATAEVAAALRRAWTGFVHDGEPGWARVGPGRATVGPDGETGEAGLGVFGGREPVRPPARAWA